jgi:hypothetical protein
MKTLKLAALSLAVLTAVVPARAEEKQDTKKDMPAPAAAPSQDEMMAAMAKASTPGERHKVLARSAGDWKVTTKMWMAPDQPPIENTGTMKGEMVLGGRYLQAIFKSTFMGQPFEGRSLDAYDNIAQTFTNTWIDNMGTGVLISRGDCSDPSCKVITLTGLMVDPMSGGKVNTKTVTTWQDDDHYKMEMWSDDGKGAGEVKMMELMASRAK